MKDFLTDEEMAELEGGTSSNSSIISDEEMARLEAATGAGSSRVSGTGFAQRLKLGFGGKEAKAEQQRIETEKGLKGKFDVGDVADVAGAAIPFVTGILGAAGGTVAGMGVGGVAGAGIGAAAGESIKQSIGRSLGVRGDRTIGQEAKDVAFTGASAYLGGKFGNYILSRLPKLLGIFSAEGDDAIRAALANPKKADIAIEQGDDALRNVITEASKKSIELKNSFNQGYKQAFDSIAKSFPNKVASRQKILYQFVDDLNKQGVKASKGALDFTTSKISANPGEIGKINAAYKAIQEWDDFTLRGVNELKQLVGALTKFADDAGVPSKSPFLGKYYHYLDSTIKNSLPSHLRSKYAAINKVYSDNIDMIDDMVDAFNRGDPFTRIAGVLANNKDSLRQVINFYDKHTGSGVIPTVAGRVLAQEKNAAFGFINPRSWVDFFIAPKLQGRIITRAGKLSNPIKEGAASGYQAYKSGVEKLAGKIRLKR